MRLSWFHHHESIFDEIVTAEIMLSRDFPDGTETAKMVFKQKWKNIVIASAWFHVYHIQSINVTGFISIARYCKSDKNLKKASTTAT